MPLPTLALSIPRRPRLLPTVLLCAVLLAYFAWFHAYTRSPSSTPLVPPFEADTASVPSPAPAPAPAPVPAPTRAPRILLVSALFPLQHAKHSAKDYRKWLTHFLGPTGVHAAADIYFYTTPSLEPLVWSLWGSESELANHTSPSTRLTVNTTYTTPFALPPVKPHREKYTRMHGWDRERAKHSPELYAVWNAKPWLVEQALLAASSSSSSSGGMGTYDYVFWTDAGAFRTPHAYRAWPDPRRVEAVFREMGKGKGTGGEDRVLFPLWTLPGRREYEWTKEKGPVDMDFAEGSFFGSTPAGIAWYARAFYALHDHYISTAPPPSLPSSSSLDHHPHAAKPTPAPAPASAPFHFVGKDQTLINALIFLHPHRFIGALAPIPAALLPPTSASTSAVQNHTGAEDEDEDEDGSGNPAKGKGTDAYALTLAYALQRTHTKLRVHAALLFGLCGSEWYYYQWWLASPRERTGTEVVRGWGPAGSWWARLGLGSGSGSGLGSGLGWCEETPVLGVERVLGGLFGRRWVQERVREAG